MRGVCRIFAALIVFLVRCRAFAAHEQDFTMIGLRLSFPLPFLRTLTGAVAAASLAAGVALASGARPDFGFSGKPVIRLDVARVSAHDLEARILTPDEVLGTGKADPRSITYTWVGERLAAVGDGGTVTVSVMASSVRTEELEVEDGVGGWFEDSADARLTAHLSVHAEYVNGPVRQYIDVTVNAMRETHESQNAEERREVYDLLMRDVGMELDRQLSEAIAARWGAIIVP